MTESPTPAFTAVVVTDPFYRNVRCRPTFVETMALARAFSDGDCTGEARCVRNASRVLPGYTPAHWIIYPALGYATIRDYLIDEHDADPRIAAACALRMTTFRSHYT